VLSNIGAAGGEPLKMKTVGAMLKDAGYQTAYFGKWHLGKDPVASPGWDEDFGVTGKETRDDEEVTRRALAFLADRKQGRHGQGNGGRQKPFALFLSYNDPHEIYRLQREDMPAATRPVPLSDSWRKETFEGKPPVQKQFMTDDQGKVIWGRPQEAWDSYRDFYNQRVAIYDKHLGRVLDQLKADGLWEDTVVVVTSDHGDMDTNHRLIFKGPFMYEHMVRVPLVIRMPAAFGGAGPKEVSDDVVNVDMAPTLLDLAGLPPVKCDGLSLKSFLTGRGAQPRRDFVIGQYYGKQRWVNPIRMIRKDRFKYNLSIDHGEELYDLQNDPHELVNLAGEAAHAARKKELRAQLDKWIAENDDPFYSFKTTPHRKRGGGGGGE